jgi:RNA polymerase sigma-70 factor, ECF subfamily
MDFDDAHLCRQLAAGDHAALGQLYDRHGPRCYRMAFATCSSAVMAEDAVQEVFMRLVKDPLRYASIAQLSGYLITMAKNAAVDQLRRSRRQENVENEKIDENYIASPDGEEANERNQRIDAAIKALSDEQREVVVLHLWDNLSFADIGIMLKISANTVASRWRYARTYLAQQLKDLS